MVWDVVTGMPGSLVENSQAPGNHLFSLDGMFLFCALALFPLQKYVLSLGASSF